MDTWSVNYRGRDGDEKGELISVTASFSAPRTHEGREYSPEEQARALMRGIYRKYGIYNGTCLLGELKLLKNGRDHWEIVASSPIPEPTDEDIAA